MKIVKVALADRSYQIHIGAGLLSRAGQLLADSVPGGRAIVITNPTVKGLYGSLLEGSLEAAGIRADVLGVPDGEEHKSLDSAGELYTSLADLLAERNTPILALGGGVIGDLAGFTAATFMRGLPLVQLPTTLLAQVDSSIGGKTAVNHGKLKNMVGDFYQPRLVISDTATLKTLPEKEFTNGMAEVIKSAAIADAGFFSFLETNLEKIKARDEATMEEVVYRCASIKAGVVSQDERDGGYRNILNFGHTIGHGIETASNFNIGHGAAVAIGMVNAAAIAVKMGLLEESEALRLAKLIQGAGLPTEVAPGKTAQIMETVKHDKKVAAGKVRFILPQKMGEVVINDDVPMSLVKEVLG
jgi:3-dehydroquinate synthase